jgi:hypothetical protein
MLFLPIGAASPAGCKKDAGFGSKAGSTPIDPFTARRMDEYNRQLEKAHKELEKTASEMEKAARKNKVADDPLKK